MKKLFVVLCCIFLNVFCTFAHAQCADKNMGIIKQDLSNLLSDIECTDIMWQKLYKSCVLLFDESNNVIINDKNYGHETSNGEYIIMGSDWRLDENLIDELSNGSEYLKAIEQYSGMKETINGIIYTDKCGAVVLTEKNLYVLTGYNSIWENVAENMEVLTIKMWKAMYEDYVISSLYVNNILIDEISYMYPSGVHVPLRSTLEACGLNIDWNDENEEIIINDKIKLDCNLQIPNKSEYLDDNIKYMSGSYVDRDLKFALTDNTYTTRYVIYDNKIYLNNQTMKYILKYFNYDIIVNFPKREIRINSIC